MKRTLAIKLRAMRLMSRMMPSCEDVTRLVSAGMDQHLSLGDRLKVRTHLLFCQWCSMFEEQLRLLRTLVREEAGSLDGEDLGDTGRLVPGAKAKLQAILIRECA
ncbi:MAG: zf-HC2 domain-containing protein [Candidatus Zixiibacteriota bacterium]